MFLNLVFHHVLNDQDRVDCIYSCKKSFFNEFFDVFDQKFMKNEFMFSDYRIYFDDGGVSFKYNVFPFLSKKKISKCTLAIVTDWLDKPGYLTKNDLKNFLKLGVRVVSHSVSHPGLSSFKNGKLLKTLPGGNYSTSPYGQVKVLKEKEVLFQMIESKKKLETILKHNVDEFVFPHGLYNTSILDLNKNYDMYKVLSTCDEYLDDGDALRPRFLVRSDLSPSFNVKKILELTLSNKNKLLTRYENKN